MSSQQPLDDPILVQYLLGSLPEADAERIEELSITDDDTAQRLLAIEHDLVDAYVHGELSGAALDKFKTSYLATPERRNKVIIANALLALERPVDQSSSRWLAWAAAILIAAAGIAYVLGAPRIQEHPVQTQPVAKRHAPAPTATAPATVTLLLLPPTRGVAKVETLRLPARTAHVNVRLQLESDDFPAYEAALRDLATNDVVWRSQRLTANAKSVSFDLPATNLKEQNYSLELSGVPAAGAAEVIGSYPFRVTLQ